MSALDGHSSANMSTVLPQNGDPTEMLYDTKNAEDLQLDEPDGAEKEFMIYVNSLTTNRRLPRRRLCCARSICISFQACSS